jgi:hypothetical protein
MRRVDEHEPELVTPYAVNPCITLHVRDEGRLRRIPWVRGGCKKQFGYSATFGYMNPFTG